MSDIYADLADRIFHLPDSALRIVLDHALDWTNNVDISDADEQRTFDAIRDVLDQQ